MPNWKIHFIDSFSKVKHLWTHFVNDWCDEPFGTVCVKAWIFFHSILNFSNNFKPALRKADIFSFKAVNHLGKNDLIWNMYIGIYIKKFLAVQWQIYANYCAFHLLVLQNENNSVFQYNFVVVVKFILILIRYNRDDSRAELAHLILLLPIGISLNLILKCKFNEWKRIIYRQIESYI